MAVPTWFIGAPFEVFWDLVAKGLPLWALDVRFELFCALVAPWPQMAPGCSFELFWALMAEWLPGWALDVHFELFCVMVTEELPYGLWVFILKFLGLWKQSSSQDGLWM